MFFKYTTFVKSFFLLLSFGSLFYSQAQTAALDLNFNQTGYKTIDFYGNTDVASALAVQQDGKIIAAGIAATNDFLMDAKVVRLNTDGTLDESFGVGGVVDISPLDETHITCIQIRQDGKILCAGMTRMEIGTFRVMVALLNSDGTPDATFGTNGIATPDLTPGDDIMHAMLITPSSKILLAGTITDPFYNNVPAVIRLNSNGSVDGGFGNQGVAVLPVSEMDNSFYDLALQSDGKIVACGHYFNSNFAFSALVARFTSNGVLDTTFGTSGKVTYPNNQFNHRLFGLTITDSDEIVATGMRVGTDQNFYMLLMKFNSNGSMDTNFGNSGLTTWGGSVPYCTTLDVQQDQQGNLFLAGGVGEFIPGNSNFVLFKYQADGTAATEFGNNGRLELDIAGMADEANALALVADQKIYLAGKSMNELSGFIDFTVAAYNLAEGVSVEPIATSEWKAYPNPAVDHLYVETTQPGGQLQLIDSQGRVVVRKNIQQGRTKFDVSALSAGLYLARFEDKNGEEAQILRLFVRP